GGIFIYSCYSEMFFVARVVNYIKRFCNFSLMKKVTDKIIKNISQSAVRVDNRFYVIPREGKWILRKDKSERVSGIFVTRDEAISAGKEKIKLSESASVVVHGMNGNITN